MMNKNLPIFIFEGPDNSGKDTLIGMLKKYIWDNCHETTLEIHPKFEKNIANEYKEYFKEECFQTIEMLKNINDRIVIFNRFVYSEYIYGQKYRNYKIDYIENIENEISDLNRPIFLFYITAKAAILRTREDGLSFSKGDLTSIQNELDLYNDVMSKSTCDYIKIDTSLCCPEDDFKKIIKEIKKINICNISK